MLFRVSGMAFVREFQHLRVIPAALLDKEILRSVFKHHHARFRRPILEIIAAGHFNPFLRRR